MQTDCPCHSQKAYSECCQPFHNGLPPDNALLLMRSRYSAYALNLPEYLIATTHPANPQYSENRFNWKRGLSQFSQATQFKNLEILSFQEKEDLAVVTFFIEISQNGEEKSFTERSIFHKKDGFWLYRSGTLRLGRELSLIHNSPLKTLPLTYYGNPILRKRAKEIELITPEIKALASDMIETMELCDGAGLAAPQVGHAVRLFIIRVFIEKGLDDILEGDIKVMINPQLIAPSNETWLAPEGCLSIPTIQHQVERPREITVEYQDLEGNLITERYSGWTARAIMHENDHINGVLFIDRLNTADRELIQPLLEKLKKRIN